MAKQFDPATDSWAPGEPIPPGMPSANDFGGASTAEADAARKIADATREGVATDERLAQGAEHAIHTGLDRMEAAYQQEGASLHDPALQPWNEKEQAAKYQTDPIAAFGSLGSVFGILASAFTHAPMENALNASAAAINAIKQGNRQAYEDARKAWESNYKLALERQKIQHELYTDADTLLRTNLAAFTVQSKLAATRLGDKKAMALLDAGMIPEFLQYREAQQKITAEGLKNQEALLQWTSDRSFYMEKYDELVKQGKTPRQAQMLAGQALQEEKARIKREASPFANRAGLVTNDRAIAADAEAFKQRMRVEHPDWSQEKLDTERDAYFERRKISTSAPTGNRIDELVGKEGQVDQATDLVNKIDGLLAKHNAITGLGGTVTRPTEIVGNVFGSNETDRKQFERWVHELQMIAPQILLGRGGRPLAAEWDTVNSVVAGLRPGDTAANTVRAYREFSTVLKSIKARLRERRGEKAETPTASSTAPSWRDQAIPLH